MFLQDLWDLCFAGRRQVTTQTTIEANIKRGIQFDCSIRFSSIDANGGTQTMGITTGDERVIIHERYIAFDGGATEIQYQASKKCEYTGGDPIQKRNNNHRSKNTGKFTVVSNPAVSNQGELYLDPFSIISGGAGSSKVGTEGRGKITILEPNTQHVFSFTNPSAQVASPVFWWITVSEGDPEFEPDLYGDLNKIA